MAIIKNPITIIKRSENQQVGAEFFDNITTIYSKDFQDCSALKTIRIPNSVVTINDYAFQGSSVESVFIGSDSNTAIQRMGSNTFRYSDISYLTIYATTPPTIGTSAFAEADPIAIYVPAESVQAYKSASGWSVLADIIQAIPS